MKFRCVTDSIRLRLTKPDIQALRESGLVHIALQLSPGQAFSVGLVADSQASEPQVSLTGLTLSIRVPHKVLQSWMDSPVVSLEWEKGALSDTDTHILIEKDFPCKDREGEVIENTFWELADGKSDSC